MLSQLASTPRNYLVFQASFPTEGGWLGDEPDQKNPPGRELMEFLLGVVSPGAGLTELWDEEGYGWAFNATVNGITVNVLLQRLDYWLVIAEEVSLKPRFMRGARHREAVLTVCQRIRAAAEADGRFSDFKALTCQEHTHFERSAFECSKAPGHTPEEGGAA